MKDPALIRQFADLGMDDLSYRAVALLPLVQVAWADGEVQAAERALMFGLVERFTAGEEGQRLLDNWLAHPPSADYLRRGREALAGLLANEPDHGLGERAGAEILDLAKQVAKAAGGVFGIGATSRAEQAAIDEVAAALGGGGAPGSAPAAAPALPPVKGPNRVTITFTATTTFEAAASGGVVEAEGQKFVVDRKGLALGSGDGADLRVENDPEVTASHCRFHEANRKFYVTATDRAVPVWVNGEKAVDRRLLGGETIRVGQVEVVFKLLRKIPKQLF